MHNEFPLNEDLIYLNHAAVSPWPKRTVDAIQLFAHENLRMGAAHYPKWMLNETNLRRQLKQLLNAPSINDIALVKNTSEAISFIAAGIEWKYGDSIVSSNQEFPSNRMAWEALEDQGVSFREADLEAGNSPEEALFNLVDESTRLLTISSVQYASGLKLNVELIGSFCKANNILFMIDAIQSLGAMAFDVQACQADFVMADGHKWLLAPEGLGVFYITEEARKKVKPSEYGWHMVEHPGDYDNRNWTIAESARRYECGSPNMLGVHALSASVSLLLEVGLETIETKVLERTRYLIQLIDQQENLELLSSRIGCRQSGILTFRHKQLSYQDLFERLKHHNVICAQRGNGIRFSPHFYSDKQHLERAISIASSV